MGVGKKMFLTGPEVPSKSEKAKYLVLVLHGVGADGNNMLPIAKNFNEIFPGAHFICPNGIAPYDMAPIGYQWFSLQDRTKHVQYNELEKAREAIEPYIDRQLSRLNLEYKDLVIISFSQGTMLSMHMVPRWNKRIRAVAGFSGAMSCPEKLEEEINSRPPFFLVHGEEDEVVLPENLYTAERTLIANGVRTESLMLDDLGHSIDDRGIHFMQKNLKTVM
jgi:phospholipase/carboxylesterase